MTMIEEARSSGTFPSLCQLCINNCGVLVTVADGRAVRVTGDDANELSEGYTCVKGRALPTMLNSPDRLHRSLKRVGDGFEEIGSREAIREIADRVRSIVEQHGPRSVAIYLGTYAFVGTPLTAPLASAFAAALGTPMVCTPNPIDQGGKIVARSLHGEWKAPARTTIDSDVALFVGINPLVSHMGLPTGHPGKWLKGMLDRGTKIIVIDPRRSDLARRAFLHIQPVPGEDSALIAAFLHVMLNEGLFDSEFVNGNVAGLDELRRAVASFTPQVVAQRAGVPADDIVLAARTIGSSRRVWAAAGTGANMGQSGTLVEYLLLAMQTLCGTWARPGDLVPNPGTLIPTVPAKAQAVPPFPGVAVGEPMRVHGLTASLAGVPTAALPAEILLEGEGRVRALISVGGNPVVAWPDQIKTIDAMHDLELLVQVDPWMSQTARVADYVLAPKMCLEKPTTTLLEDLVSGLAMNYIRQTAWGQYGPAVVDAPDDSDLIEEWQLFFLIAQEMGLQLTLPRLVPSGTVPPHQLEMHRLPASDELLDILSRGSRIPFTEVKERIHGGYFADPPLHVSPKDEGWTGRLDVGNALMMGDLHDLTTAVPEDPRYQYRLISRRMMQVHNTPGTKRGRSYNPAFMNHHDMAALGLWDRDRVRISSATGVVTALVELDDSVRAGCVSMAHCFGDDPSLDGDVAGVGSSTSRLCSMDRGFDRYVGQPRMSNIPVAIEKFP